MIYEWLKNHVGNQVSWFVAEDSDSLDNPYGELNSVQQTEEGTIVTITDVRRRFKVYGDWVHVESARFFVQEDLDANSLGKNGDLIVQTLDGVTLVVHPYTHESNLYR